MSELPRPDDGEPLLVVDDLETHYTSSPGLFADTEPVRAVDGVSFELHHGEALGIVGESGCGKTTLVHSLLRLEKPTGGSIDFDGTLVTDLTGDQLRALRRRVQLVVQDPNEAFNPRMRVGEAVAEPLRIHGMTDANRRDAIVADVLERVGMSAELVDRYPHEFSVGELQRLAIARALVLDPDLIIADEPTSALDGRTREAVLSLLDTVCREYGVSILVVSHDIDIVRRFCDTVAVMYLGEIVEQGPVTSVLDDPAHPYSRVLLDAVPTLDPSERATDTTLTESVPDAAAPPSGCRFHPRCPEVIPPQSVDLSADTWQSIAAFRFALETDTVPGAVDETAELTSEAVRNAFDLPHDVADEQAAQSLDRAIEALINGDRNAARETLSQTFPSVCERSSPNSVSTDERLVSCHRYDSASESDPLPR